MKSYTITCLKCKRKITRQEKYLKANSFTGCICECGNALVFPSIKEFKWSELHGRH